MIGARIRRIETGGQDHHRAPSAIDGALVRRPIDPDGATRNHDEPVEHRLPRKRVGEVERLVVCPARPDDGDGALKVWKLPYDPELRRRIHESPQPRRKPRAGRSQQPSALREPPKHGPGIDQIATWLRGAQPGARTLAASVPFQLLLRFFANAACCSGVASVWCFTFHSAYGMP